jgi:hypothetical protein
MLVHIIYKAYKEKPSRTQNCISVVSKLKGKNAKNRNADPENDSVNTTTALGEPGLINKVGL